MKKLNEIVYKCRIFIYASMIFGAIAQVHAFWPPDLIPHPQLPEPKEPDPMADTRRMTSEEITYWRSII